MWLEMTSVTLLEASSSARSQIALLQPPSLPLCVFSSSVHPFSVGASGFPSTDLLSHFPQGPSPTPQDFCAEVLLVCDSSLPPHPVFTLHLSGCLLDVTSWESLRHLQNPVYHLLNKPALPPRLIVSQQATQG